MPRQWRQDIGWGYWRFFNTIDAGFQVPGAGDSLTPFLESDPVLGDVDEHYSGDYLNQDTVMKAARGAGLNTASIGKLGPVLIFDHTERSGEKLSSLMTALVGLQEFHSMRK